MGADIHMVLEKRAKVRDREVWIGVNAFPFVKATVFHYEAATQKHSHLLGKTSWQARERNYDMFAALAGVRGDGPAPRDLPDDASDLTLLMADGWGEDGHSHSWMLMSEAMPIIVGSGQLGPQADALLAAFKHGTSAALNGYMENFWSMDDDETLDDYRLCFWFDN